MQQISIRLPEGIYKIIKQNSEKQRRSVNSEIVKMLEDYFADSGSTTDQAAGLRQVIGANNG